MTARYREWTRAARAARARRSSAIAAVAARRLARSRARRRRARSTLELGRDEPTARLARFVAAYGRTIGALARSGTRIEHVDLRYRNGFAARVPGFRETAAEEAGADAEQKE